MLITSFKSKCGSLTAKIVAEVMGVKPAWVNAAMRHLGNVGTMKKGGGCLYSETDIDRLIELQKTGWTPAR